MGNCISQIESIAQPGNRQPQPNFYDRQTKNANGFNQELNGPYPQQNVINNYLGNNFGQITNQKPMAANQNYPQQSYQKQTPFSYHQNYSQSTSNIYQSHPQNMGQNPPQQALIVPVSKVLNTKVKLDNTQTKTNLNGLPSQKDFLNDIKNLLSSKPQLAILLPKDLFNYLYNMYNAEYWTNESRELLIKLLISYIKFSINQLTANSKNQTKYTISNFGQKFGKDCYKIFNEVKMKNVWILQSLQYSNTFMPKNFSLDNYQNLLQTANQVRNLCSNITLSLVYLSGYLIKCCSDLQKNRVPITKINEILKEPVKKLKEQFSPLKKLQEQKEYNKRSFEKQEVDKIKSQEFKFSMVTLAFKTDNKENQLEDFIMEMVDLSKKHYSSFTELTSSCCLQSEGFAYKSNLKLKQRTQQMPLLRVKQKLLKDEVAKSYKNKTYDNCKTVSQLRAAQIAYLNVVLNQVYSKMSQIKFSVSDLLRGKCMFNKIAHINFAAEKIIKKVKERASKGQNIQIVEIDNRLEKITTDLVLKIRMEDLVCEFQLALKFNQAENQIHHKMYEVQRSKVFTPVTMLYNWHNALVADFFNNVDRILNQTQPNDKSNLMNMSANLKNFLQFKEKTKPASVALVTKQDNQYLSRIKSQINNIAVSQELAKKIDLRAGKVLKQMKKYKDALNYLLQCSQKFGNDAQLLLQLADTYRNIGQYKNAAPLYQRLITMFKNASNQKQKVQQAYMQLSQCYKEMQKLKKAHEILQIAQQFQKRNFGQNSANYAKTMIDTSSLMRKLGKLKKAAEYLQVAISIYQNNKLTDDINYGKAYLKLAEIYDSNGIFSKAFEYLNKSLSIIQHLTSKQSLETAEVNRAYGTVYQNLGKHKQAEQYYKKYLTATQNLVSKDSMDYATALFYLCYLYREMQRFKQSQGILQQCERITLKISGKKSSEYMQIKNAYGLYYLEINDCERALKQFQESIKLLQQMSEEKSPNMAALYGNIALTYQNQQDYETAMQFYQKQGVLLQQIFGKQSSQVCFATLNIVALLIQLNQIQEARQALLQMMAVYQKLGTQNNQGFIKTMEYLAHVEVKLGNIQDAQKYYQKLLKINEVTTGKDSPQYAAICFSIGEVFVQAGNHNKAKQWFMKSLNIYKKLQHPRQQELQQTIYDLDNIAE